MGASLRDSLFFSGRYMPGPNNMRAARDVGLYKWAYYYKKFVSNNPNIKLFPKIHINHFVTPSSHTTFKLCFDVSQNIPTNGLKSLAILIEKKSSF